MADQDQVEFGDEEEEDIIDDEEEEDIINHAEMGQKPEEIEVIEDQEDDQEDIDIEEEGLELDMAEEDDEDEHENRDRGIRYGRETFGEECIQRNKKKEEEEDNEEEDEGKKESIDMDHIHEKALGRTEEKVYQPQQGYRKEDVFSKKEIVSTQDKVDADVMDESNKEDDPMSRPPLVSKFSSCRQGALCMTLRRNNPILLHKGSFRCGLGGINYYQLEPHAQRVSNA